MEKQQPPRFVKMNNHTALILDGDRYYCHGGQWGIRYKFIDNVLHSWFPEMRSIHRIPLVETTEEEWRRCNGSYAPENIEDTVSVSRDQKKTKSASQKLTDIFIVASALLERIEQFEKDEGFDFFLEKDMIKSIISNSTEE